MAEERLDLIKDVFNKAEYIKTINTSFSELGVTSITEDQQLQPTVEEFFGLYNSLFYDIPALGETNSHEYLAKTSGEYVNFNANEEEIAALRNEITGLRQQLLEEQIATVEALTGQNINITGSNENVVSTGVLGNALNNSGLSNPGPGTGGNAGGVY